MFWQCNIVLSESSQGRLKGSKLEVKHFYLCLTIYYCDMVIIPKNLDDTQSRVPFFEEARRQLKSVLSYT